MRPTVGVAPGTVTLMVQNNGLGRTWMDPGGAIPTSPREPQVHFLTSPFTPPASTTPIVYLGAGPPPGTPLCIPGTPGYGMASFGLQGFAPSRKTAVIVGVALGLAAIGIGIGAALSVNKKNDSSGVAGADLHPEGGYLPGRSEPVTVKSEGAGRWSALVDGRWRRVHVQVNKTFIVSDGKRIPIRIDGV